MNSPAADHGLSDDARNEVDVATARTEPDFAAAWETSVLSGPVKRDAAAPRDGLAAQLMPSELRIEHTVFLSTELAGRREVRAARVAAVVSGALFVAAVPFAGMPLAHVAAFTPMYISALVICDVITAVLLFSQFHFLRSRALLVLASGYLFTALMACCYLPMFPGLFSAAGLLDAGPQSTSAMYMFWHAGFPLAIIGYALLKNEGLAATGKRDATRSNPNLVILATVALVLCIVIAFTIFVTAGNRYLPVFIRGDSTSELGRLVLCGDWVLSLVALGVLWTRRSHTAIDLWILVVLCAWLFELALSAILNTGRYDLGWYAGRLYGLLAASFLLALLLIKNSSYYARLVRMSARLTTLNTTLERLSQHDGLTNLANRRFFDKYLARQIAVARRHERILALVMCDVDSFKAYNDHYGHQAGDECLKQVAIALRSCCHRPADMVARYGGEEFALVLPDTDQAGAARIAEAAKDAVARLGIPHAHSLAAPHVSISGGVAVLHWKVEYNAQRLIGEADEALYKAKQRGRNRMVVVRAEAM